MNLLVVADVDLQGEVSGTEFFGHRR